MILTIDVGNTNLVFGIYKGNNLKASYRTATHHEYTEDEYGLVLTLLGLKGIDPKGLKGGIFHR